MNTQPQLLRVVPLADLPVIWAFLQQMDLLAHLDQLYPAPPHWKGPLTPGDVLAVWLLFIVSRSDHRLNQVQPWVEQHQAAIAAFVGKPIRPTDFHDDRLADWLTRLANADQWADLEQGLNQHLIRVYQLPTELVRIDMTTANSHADVVSEQGLLQFGHSKDDPSRPQLKVAAALLDPLGLPLATAVVPGNTADDPLYVPAIQAVQKSIGCGGKTYVGDCKMAALATRLHTVLSDDYYLCPLPEVQIGSAERQRLLQPVWEGTQTLESVYRTGPDGPTDEVLAEGFSVEVTLTAPVDERSISWTERRWLVRSLTFAKSQTEALEKRLTKAEAALRELTVRKQGKKRLSESELRQAATALVTRPGVTGLLDFMLTATTTTQRKRAYGSQPEKEVTIVEWTITPQRKEAAILEATRQLGWQIYGTNALAMSLSEVIKAYRGQYRIEDGWSRLKGRPLGLTPLYLQDEERIKGLVHLLMLAMRVLVLVEWVAREELRKTKSKLKGVYAGQPGRQTTTPSAELLLEAMKTISVSVIQIGDEEHVLLTPLSPVQKQLLKLWQLPLTLYENTTHAISKIPRLTSEP